MAALLVACGGESSSDSNERAGTYKLEVVDASFPNEQFLGQTTLMKLGVRNAGDKQVPNVVVTVSVGGKAGQESSLPFGVRDPQAELAQSDRPVWVLSEHYPRFAGSTEPGGASTSNRKTFALGPLEPGATTTAVWKLSAVKAGDWQVLYRVGAGLGTQVKAETPGGGPPGGSFAATITSEPPETEVTDNGEVVQIQSGGKRGGE